MDNEMKRKFYEQLHVKIKNKKSNNSFLNREKYELLIQEISQLKRGDSKKEPKDYQLLKRYDVVQIGNSKNDLPSCRRELFNEILCTNRKYV